ncbi:MAG TPA: hypothetical protein VK689_23190 [Armatimonadota bacterium]|nr:hypothetical protein [Armatimonadota bacterium]
MSSTTRHNSTPAASARVQSFGLSYYRVAPRPYAGAGAPIKTTF